MSESNRKLHLLFLLFLYAESISGGAFKDIGKENKHIDEKETKNKHKNIPSTALKAVNKEGLLSQKKLVPTKIQKLARKCQCGRAEMTQMAPLILTNLDDNSTINLLFQSNPKELLGKGTYSKVYHAKLVTIGSESLTKCVALKMTLKDLENSDWQKHIKEWKIQKAFDTLPERERRHIIKLYAYGYHKMGNKEVVFSILELGRGDFNRHMKKKRYNWFSNQIKVDDRIIEADFRQLVETVRDMHQKIMHLDLKPGNLVYVQQGKDLVMKAIDFGASQFIDEDEWDEEDRAAALQQANACKWFVINDPLTTEFYQSPEHFYQCNWNYEPEKEHSMKLSSKSDIWAIGIIAFEMASIGSEFKWMFDNEGAEYDLTQIVGEVHHVIAQFWRLYIENKNDIKERMDNNWDEFNANFITILNIRSRFPRIFHIITAVLVHKPEQRPTARGILDFLDGKCRFESIPKIDMLFPWLSMEQLKAQLAKKKLYLFKEELEATNNATKKLLQKKIDEVQRLIELAKVDEWDPSDKQQNVPCDTTTNKSMPNGLSPMTASENSLQLNYSGGWKNDASYKEWLLKIEKTIGLSLCPRIQNADAEPLNADAPLNEYQLTMQKYKGLFENLQESFYNRSFETPKTMNSRFVGLLSTIGYSKLLKQLDVVVEQYKEDAKMLKNIVQSIREQLGFEWDEVYEIAAQYECEEGDDTFVQIIDQISAVYLYKLMYTDLNGKLFNENSHYNFSSNEFSRPKFLVNWLHVISNNLKRYNDKNENGILAILRHQKEQFMEMQNQLHEEMKAIMENRREKRQKDIDELDEIWSLVEQEMELIRKEIDQNKSQMRRAGRANANIVHILLKQKEDLLKSDEESKQILVDIKNRRAFLVEEYQDEDQRLSLDYDEKMNKITLGLQLNEVVANKIGQFKKNYH